MRVLQLALCAIPALVLAADLSYPEPPNPFAAKKPATGDGKPSLVPAPRAPPEDSDAPLLPGGEVEGGGDAADAAVATATATTAGKFGALGGPSFAEHSRLKLPPSRKARRSALSIKPTLTLAALSFACYHTRPREASLLSAIDSLRDHLPSLESAEPAVLRDCGLACVALHADLVWLGLLGCWLPLLPIGLSAVGPWASVAQAPHLLVSALLVGACLRKLMPRAVADAHLSVSLDGLRKGRLYTLLTSALSPAGLLHALHAAVVLLGCTADLPPTVSRVALLLLYVGSGAAAAVASALTQLVFGRRSQPRVSVSGAAMGVLLTRAALLPHTPISVGGTWELPPLRAALLHIALDAGSNGATSVDGGAILGIEKVLSMLGAAVLVALTRPTLSAQLAETVRGGDWRGLLAAARAAI